MTGLEALVCAIFEQAIEDYEFLMANQIEIKRNGAGTGMYSIKDIESFFGSKWCIRLLRMINSDLTGTDILNAVQTKCVVDKEVLS